MVLTFDDGPLPRYTKPILDALDQFCTKATFFNVGEMAMAYPSMVKEVIARGHTVGAHTWSHPMNMRHLSLDKAEDQIERGFAAVALAAGKPVAPFFRFPGLSDSGPMLAYLQERGIAAFTVDVVSNDSYIGSPQRLIQRTIAQIEQQNGGIVLFHDIKASTAKALPTILAELEEGRLQDRACCAPRASSRRCRRSPPSSRPSGGKARGKGRRQAETVPFFTSIAPSTLEATIASPP